MGDSSFDPARKPEYYEMVLDALPEVVLTINRDFVITSFNHAAEELCGLRRTGAIGRPCREVLHTAVCDHIAECPMTEMLRTGTPAVREFRAPGTRKHGAAIVRVVLHALRDAAGEIIGGVETITAPATKPSTHGRPTSRDDHGSAKGDSAGELTILDASERRAIEGVLRRHDWNQSEACRELGISRITLWRKMRKLGINRP